MKGLKEYIEESVIDSRSKKEGFWKGKEDVIITRT